MSPAPPSPPRWILLYWGVNKFRKGLLGSKPAQGKLGCLLARVPHSQDLVRSSC